jgi:shikimate dehydrogenase
MMIDQRTKLYGVVGYPLGHTLSPAMHNAAFSESGLNAVYLTFETRDIAGCLRGMKALGLRGMSVTLPHKTKVVPLLDGTDDVAKRIGAVNTIVNEDGRLIGFNTDGIGALKALEKASELSGKTCLLIGAGGAARAIGFVLKENGVQVILANRSAERGRALALSLGCPFVPLDGLEGTTADLLINATPVGMAPQQEACPVPESTLKDGMVVMDIVYNPLETRLLRAARARGCLTVDGLGMFVHQGAEQFRLWTGLEAPTGAMTQAVEKALGGGVDS